MKGYSFDFKKYNEDALAKAKLERANISFKDACAVCDAIRNKGVKEAMLLLERVINMETPIYYRRHNKKMAHRKELGGKKGRWPVKEAKFIRKLVKSLIANAISKGLDETSLIIIHASANKKESYPKLQPVGRRVRHDYELARVELVAIDTSFKEDVVKKRKEKLRKIEEEKEKLKKKIEEASKAKQGDIEKKEEKKEEEKEKIEKTKDKKVKDEEERKNNEKGNETKEKEKNSSKGVSEREKKKTGKKTIKKKKSSSSKNKEKKEE